MLREIERKFLVKNNDFLHDEGLAEKLEITQGFLSKKDGKIIRIRRTNSLLHTAIHGYITLKIKNPIDFAAGVNEYEYEIPEEDATALLHECEHPLIEKIRHMIEYGNHVWEVDIFHGAQSGLIVAEIELSQENEEIDFPSWVGEEVTGKPAFYNANM